MALASDWLPDLTGQSIDQGRYHLISELGSGTFGRVYHAVSTKTSVGSNLPKFFAIKCLPLKAHVSGGRKYQFQRNEVAIHHHLSKKDCLASEHIALLHDVIYSDDYAFLVMELFFGGDLLDAIVDQNMYLHNDDLIRSHYLQILKAVQACHSSGIYHRDLKPDNFLLSKDLEFVFLTDFGLATTENECVHFNCGTDRYMSPENVTKGSSARAPYFCQQNDIWSLGVILFNLVACLNPWESATSNDPGFTSYLTSPNNYFADVFPGLSQEANDLLQGILDPDPLSRFKMDEIVEKVELIESFYHDPEERLTVEEIDSLVDPFRRTCSSDSSESLEELLTPATDASFIFNSTERAPQQTRSMPAPFKFTHGSDNHSPSFVPL